MEKNDEVSVYITIFDFANREELEKLVEIPNCKLNLKGDIRRPGVLYKKNTWSIKSDLIVKNEKDEYYLIKSINEQCNYLLNIISPYKTIIKFLTNKYHGEFSIGIYNYDGRPGIHLNKNLLKEIVDLNLELDIDIYCLSDESA